MLGAWRDDMVASDVCVFIGYNLWGFDYRYMVARHNTLVERRHAEALAEEPPEPVDGWVCSPTAPRFRMLSMFVTEPATAKPKRLSSAAMGYNELFQILATGRVTLDLLLYVKTNYKRSRYTLNAIATEFIGDQKEEISHADIYTYYDGTPEQRTRYCTYCVQDCALPVQLMFKLSVIEDYVQSSRVQWTQLSDLVSRGQQIRVFNMLHHYAHAQGYVIDKDSREQEQGNEGYEGATVLSPTPGFYQEPVATLDFASLYPSIMRAHNLCTRRAGRARRSRPRGSRRSCSRSASSRTRASAACCRACWTSCSRRARRPSGSWRARPTRAARRCSTRSSRRRRSRPTASTALPGRARTACCRAWTWPPPPPGAGATTSPARARGRERYRLDVIYGDTTPSWSTWARAPSRRPLRSPRRWATTSRRSSPRPSCSSLRRCTRRTCSRASATSGASTRRADRPAQDGLQGHRDGAPRQRAAGAHGASRLTKLVMESDPEGAVEAIRRVLASVVCDTAPFEDYITKAVGESYKNSNLAHVRVAEKLAERGVPVPPGGRVEFVILRDDGMRLFERRGRRARAPHQLVLDRVYYADKQIMTPLRNLLGNVCDLSVMFDAALAARQAERGLGQGPRRAAHGAALHAARRRDRRRGTARRGRARRRVAAPPRARAAPAPKRAHARRLPVPA